MTAINSNRAIRGPVTAVPVVAGKGVRLTADTENNRWIVEADETVLYENNSPSQIISDTSLTLSESYLHFEKVKLYLRASGGNTTQGSYIVESPVYQNENTEVSAICVVNAIGSVMYDMNVFLFNTTEPTTCAAKSNGTRLNIASSGISTTANRGARIYKIVGINRIACN
jgi:hypothetical protein